MKHYNSYMDRQEISRETHERFLNMTAKHRPARLWVRYGALAACAALIVGVGVWRLAPAPGPAPSSNSAGQFAPGYTPLPGETDTVGPEDHPLMADDSQEDGDATIFVVSSPAIYGEGKLAFPMIPFIDYPENDRPDIYYASRLYIPGEFTVELTKEAIQTIFWGPGGKPEAVHPKTVQGDLPWMLFWDGYTVHGSAWYDGQGRLIQLTILGEKDRAEFELELCPGDLPFSCYGYWDPEYEPSDVLGVSVHGWSRVYDRFGDGDVDYICGSEFMTEGGVGVRFENRNSSMQAEYGGDEDMAMGGTKTFNALFVRQAITGGLYLDHLTTAESVPAWREEKFSSLSLARLEADFAPYLPAQAPENYRGTEFYGHLSYQEGVHNYVSVCWYYGYDTVEVQVHRDGYHSYDLADPARPETYDLRLYTIPWSESVPREYRYTVDLPAFKAEDMSLAIVEARGIEKDTGGLSFRFEVVHPDGTVVSYRCDRMTAQQVWELVEETL